MSSSASFIALALLLCSCLQVVRCLQLGTLLQSLNAGGNLHPLGMAVDSAGRVYVTDPNAGSVVVFGALPVSLPSTASALPFVNFNVTATFTLSGGLNGPQAVTVDSAGRIFVCDSGNNRIVVLAALNSTHPGSLLYSFNSTQPSLSNPGGIALDGAGNIYLSDQTNNVIDVLSGLSSATPGKQLYSFNGNTTSLVDPIQVAVDLSGNIFLADSSNGRIVVLSPITSVTPGRPLFVFNASNSLSNVNGVQLDAAGNLWVVSSNTDTIVVLAGLKSTTPGAVVATCGDSSYSEPFDFAYQLAFDPQGRVYVSDYSNGRVNVLAPLNSISPPAGSTIAFIRPSFYSLSDPGGVALDRAANVYVADQNNNRIVVLSGLNSAVPGTPLAAFADNTTALDIPIAIALDATGNMYIADLFNNRVVVLASMTSTNHTPGTEMFSFSLAGTGLFHTWGVALDNKGNIYALNNTCMDAGGVCWIAVMAGISSTSPLPGTLIASYSVPGTFGAMAGLSLDAQGNIYATSPATGSLYVLAGLTSTSHTPGSLLLTVSTFEVSEWPVVDAAGRIYVSDLAAEVIYILAGLTSTSPAPGTVIGSIQLTFEPLGLAIDPTTNDILVVDNSDSLVMVLAGLAPASALGDPQLVGFLGQSFQVHGLDGGVYSVITEADLQVNARFGFLDHGSCPPVNTPCYSHPGSYFTEVSISTGKGARLLLRPGQAADGFARVVLDEVVVDVGRRNSTEATSHVAPLHSQDHSLELQVINRWQLRVLVGVYDISVDSSDGFINVVSVRVSDWKRLTSELQPHGLLGQTWRNEPMSRGEQVKEVEGAVDDYLEANNDIFGSDFVYGKFALAA